MTRTLLILLALGATACDLVIPDGGVDCTAMAASSVQVTLADPDGRAVTDAVVQFEHDGEVRDCEGTGQDWVCGWEIEGELTITVSADGFQGQSHVVDVPADLPLADADPTRLRQVLTNLASNALKFTDEGEVRFSAREGEGAELVLAVSDTGVGIPEEQQAEVFQEFGQVWGGDEESARAARRRRGGAGLGLAITRRLVELHGGSVRLESTVGEGSRFELLWPRAEEEAP